MDGPVPPGFGSDRIKTILALLSGSPVTAFTTCPSRVQRSSVLVGGAGAVAGAVGGLGDPPLPPLEVVGCAGRNAGSIISVRSRADKRMAPPISGSCHTHFMTYVS